MIRVSHFSDLHYGGKTLAEADRCFGAGIDRAIELGVDAAVISGDATDHALDLHAPAARRLAEQVRRLADHCPVLLLQGTFSHEPPGTLSLMRLLGGRFAVHVAGRIQQVALTDDRRWRASSSWRFETLPNGCMALFTCVPAVNKAVVAATTGAVEAPQAVGDRLSALLRGFASINDAARVAGVATVGVSHGTVFGCLSEHGVPMAGFDHEFTTGALFAAHAQAFLLGHIHRHQGWRQDGQHGSQAIAYAGSIGRFHHGEEGDKGFLMWTVEPCAAAYRLEPTPARRTIDITFEGRPDLKRIEEVVAEQEICGASVRVRWTVADEDRGTVDRAAIEALLSGAADVRLEGRIVPVARQRAAGVSRLSSLADKVRAWCRVADVSPAPMLSCLNTIEAVEPEAIAERVLRSEVGECTASAPEPCVVVPLAIGH